LFVNSQPAQGAVVILRPKAATGGTAEWPSGFPRATVEGDGSFTVGTYESADGAPEGEYVILVQWPTAAAEMEEETTESEDRLQGRYLDPEKSELAATIKPEPNDLGRLDLK
jgi:hypothetical protein